MSCVLASSAEVLALSPDAASSKAALGLNALRHWPSSGCNAHSVWGQCQGSGKTPYQIQIDLRGPAFKCSCPSRKFPCKHALALLLLRSSGHIAQNDSAPDWVTQWLAGREEKAQKQQEKQEQKQQQQQQQQQAQANGGDTTRDTARDAQRWAKAQAGLQALSLWLQDLLTQGLAQLQRDRATLGRWNTLAARMVDAQMPALAARIQQAWALVDSGPQWQGQLLRECSQWQLIIDAAGRHSDLPPDVQADLQAALGWPLKKADVIAQSPAEHDQWQVVGQRLIEREASLLERHTWLQGQRTGRMAWLLDYAQGGRGFESVWLPLRCYEGALHFYPGTAPLRALTASPLSPLPQDAQDLQSPQNPPTSCLQHPIASAQACVQALRGHMAQAPLRSTHPLWIPQARLWPLQGRWVATWAGEAGGPEVCLPVSIDEGDAWQLLALSAGQPLALFGAWEQEIWHILSAWQPAPSTPPDTAPSPLRPLWCACATAP